MVADILKAVLPAVLTALVTYFVLRSYKRDDVALVEKLKSDIQKEREVFLMKAEMFSESQFKIYSALWIQLCDLEISVNALWHDGVSKSALQKFIKAVGETERKLSESAILLDQSDFRDLSNIIETLKNYRVGKERLLQLRDVDDEAASEIQRQIEKNYALVNQYTDLKQSMLGKLRGKIGIN